ncbi:hypothetical protein A0H81_14294 [Grifola frondosa]|uniref:Large ribosomal subunit protein mL54 n=1 Tax=Grifola frondosa TaxID=5627 RepID=A0A1C7LP67_GRIFR|nr:hypothetical protein A0H81_14294 [Grifola frondosa]
MSFLRALRRPPRLEIRCLPRRCYATEAKAAEEPEVVVAKSSCPENTILTGVNYLKGQQPVLALADDQYPPWLWTLLQPKATDTGAEFHEDAVAGFWSTCYVHRYVSVHLCPHSCDSTDLSSRFSVLYAQIRAVHGYARRAADTLHSPAVLQILLILALTSRPRS